MEEQKLKAGDRVTQEVIDLVAGLRDMMDLDGVLFQFERLVSLARQIEDITDGEADGTDQDVINAAYWQQCTIDEIKAILKNQARIIRKLRMKLDIPAEKSFEVDPVKRDAILGLYGLFSFGGGFIGEKVALPELRAWSMTYGVDFEQVVSMLAPKEEQPLSVAG